jgi:hypothetical protein
MFPMTKRSFPFMEKEEESPVWVVLVPPITTLLDVLKPK